MNYLENQELVNKLSLLGYQDASKLIYVYRGLVCNTILQSLGFLYIACKTQDILYATVLQVPFIFMGTMLLVNLNALQKKVKVLANTCFLHSKIR